MQRLQKGYLTQRERRIIEKQLDKTIRGEERFLKQASGKQDVLYDAITGKVPRKAVQTLEKAFAKGFGFVFSHGSQAAEKSGAILKRRSVFQENRDNLSKEVTARRLRRVFRGSTQDIWLGCGLSAAEGAVLGVFGIGLPDIPVILSLLLRTVYQVASDYGFSCTDEAERVLVLHIICMALAKGEESRAYSAAADRAAIAADTGAPFDASYASNGCSAGLRQQAAAVLAQAMLVQKFVQGVPLAGAAAGLANGAIVRAVGQVARFKYKKRFLRNMLQGG